MKITFHNQSEFLYRVAILCLVLPAYCINTLNIQLLSFPILMDYGPMVNGSTFKGDLKGSW